MKGALVLASAPSGEPVTTAQAKTHARIDTTADDAYVDLLITAARQAIDGRDGWLGRALMSQTWDYYLDEFPADALEVPLPPLVSVSAITYVDDAGVTQTWAAAKYTVDTRKQPGQIVPAYGEVYPTTRDVPNAVKVTFACGYGAAADVPEPIKLALKATVAHFYDHRQPVENGTRGEVPQHVEALLAPYRIRT